jgi:poly(3-hydroxybutyrate) depolymerase
MIRFLICAAVSLIASAPVLAQQASAPAVADPAAAIAAAPVAAPIKPKKICRTNQVTGRRIAQTTCYTAAQWAEYDRVQAEAAKNLIDDVSSVSGRSDLRGSSSGGLSTASMFGLGVPQ